MTDPAIIIAAIALIGSVITAIPTFMRLRGEYKKQAASASALNVETAIKLKSWMEDEIQDLHTRTDAMEVQIAQQENEITDLRNQVRVLSNYANALIQQLIDIGVEPIVSIEEIEGVNKWRS